MPLYLVLFLLSDLSFADALDWDDARVDVFVTPISCEKAHEAATDQLTRQNTNLKRELEQLLSVPSGEGA